MGLSSSPPFPAGGPLDPRTAGPPPNPKSSLENLLGGGSRPALKGVEFLVERGGEFRDQGAYLRARSFKSLSIGEQRLREFEVVNRVESHSLTGLRVQEIEITECASQRLPHPSTGLVVRKL